MPRDPPDSVVSAVVYAEARHEEDGTKMDGFRTLIKAAGDDLSAFMAEEMGTRYRRKISERRLSEAIAATVPDWQGAGLLPAQPTEDDIAWVARKVRGYFLINWWRVTGEQLKANLDRRNRLIRFIEDMSGEPYPTWATLDM